MKKAILATKIGMTQIFTEDGSLIPITVLLAGPCCVSQKKTVSNDGYEAIQVAFGEVKESRVKKPVLGHFKKSGVEPKKYLREFKLEDLSGYELGQELKADVFAAGDRVDASGVSRGKGTQGPIRRHGFSRGPETHGSKYHRGVGSLSSSAAPSKVKKGKKMAGRMGAKKSTVQNLEVARVDAEKNLILLKGSVPGPKGALIFIKNSVKN
jgi:large subunit ribosomal protein L3